MKSDFNSPGESETRLADLPAGAEATVVAVDLDDATGRRLRDLGLLPRTRIRALRRAPLGDPSVYELRGYRLCLRRADALHVRVHVESGVATPAAPRR
jgi:ferrous iron transport protein A